MPFQPLTGHAGLVGEGADDALHGTRQGRTGIGNAEAHCIAEADLHRHAGLLGKLHEARGKGQTEAVDIGAGDVFKVTARHNAPFKGALDEAQIIFHRLLPRLAQLEIEMVVRYAGQHTDFVELHVAGDAQVVLVGANPARHAREAVATGAAGFDGLAVLGGIHEEFRGLNEAALAAQLMEQVEDVGYLADGVRRAGLLAVAEGRIGDEAGVCRAGRDDGIVEAYAADLRIRIKFTVELGILPFHKRKGTLGTFLEKLHGTSINTDKAETFLLLGRKAYPSCSLRKNKVFSRRIFPKSPPSPGCPARNRLSLP